MLTLAAKGFLYLPQCPQKPCLHGSVLKVIICRHRPFHCDPPVFGSSQVGCSSIFSPLGRVPGWSHEACGLTQLPSMLPSKQRGTWAAPAGRSHIVQTAAYSWQLWRWLGPSRKWGKSFKWAWQELSQERKQQTLLDLVKFPAQSLSMARAVSEATVVPHGL